MEFIKAIIDWFEANVINAVGDDTANSVMGRIFTAIRELLGILPEQEQNP